MDLWWKIKNPSTFHRSKKKVHFNSAVVSDFPFPILSDYFPVIIQPSESNSNHNSIEQKVWSHFVFSLLGAATAELTTRAKLSLRRIANEGENFHCYKVPLEKRVGLGWGRQGSAVVIAFAPNFSNFLTSAKNADRVEQKSLGKSIQSHTHSPIEVQIEKKVWRQPELTEFGNCFRDDSILTDRKTAPP